MGELELRYTSLIREIGYVRLLNLSDALKRYLKDHSSSLEEKVEALEKVREYLKNGRW